MKRFQPTVEDYDSDSDSASETESQTTAQDDAPQSPSRSSSLSSASSVDSVMSSPSSQSCDTAASTPPPTESPSPKDPRLSPRPTVHFSPPTIHYITTEPPEPTPEPTPVIEREELELYRTQSLPTQLRPPIVAERQVAVVAERPTPAWVPLFNDRDEPTPALGRLLRGLANYIVSYTFCCLSLIHLLEHVN
jgi:hypothetical protein